MGSVKDLIVLEEPTERQMGVGRFEFSDRYSVFDWGEMPDHVPYAGASRCMTSAYFFEQLEGSGIKTHYIGLGNDIDRPYDTREAKEPVESMQLHLVRAIKPVPCSRNGKVEYDYSFFQKARDDDEGSFVIPIELIYRNTLPRGSSVFRRLREGSLSLDDMGLAEEPKEGDELPFIFMDASTKYEEFDRYPDKRKGEDVKYFLENLGGLTLREADELGYVVWENNDIITEGVDRAGLRNDDGKFECALNPERELMIVDALGTLDECRFTYPLGNERVDMSKEIPRQWYRYKQPGWVAEIDTAKKSGEKDWKSLVALRPEPLPPQLLEILSNVYTSVSNAVMQKQVFDAPSLDEVAKEYQRFRELEMK